VGGKPIYLSCRCGETYLVDAQFAGQQLRCRACGSTLTIPAVRPGTPAGTSAEATPGEPPPLPAGLVSPEMLASERPRPEHAAPAAARPAVPRQGHRFPWGCLLAGLALTGVGVLVVPAVRLAQANPATWTMIGLQLFALAIPLIFVAAIVYAVLLVRGARAALQRAYDGIEIAGQPAPGHVRLAFHTYHGLLVVFVQTEHQGYLPPEHARELLRRLHRFNLVYGLLAYVPPLVPILSWFNYLAQQRSIDNQERFGPL